MRRYSNHPKLLSGVLRNALSQPVLKNLKLAEFAGRWEETVGPLLAQRSRIWKVDGKTLFVIAQSPAVAGEIALRRSLILERASRFGLDIGEVRACVGTVKSPRRKNPSNQRETHPVCFGEEELFEAKRRVSQKIEDERLAEAFCRLMLVYQHRIQARRRGV